MATLSPRILSANALRHEVSARVWDDTSTAQEQSAASVPSILFREDAAGEHGNFLAASYRRILANEAWCKRLEKPYTANARMPRAHDRHRRELECAHSSDALLMNVFCYPGITSRPALCALLGIERGARPEFGFRPSLAMRNGEVDRTEIDMRLGPLLVEAKLTESGFPVAARDRALRYLDLPEVFAVDDLPWTPRGLAGYQLVRGVLAAHASNSTFALLCDGRRADLKETWFRVLRAVSSCDLRSRMALITWQEFAATTPPALKQFLQRKYGIGS